MSRALVVLRSTADRQRAISWIERAPPGTRVEFRADQRSLDQNARLWAMLSDVASQKTHAGRRYTTDQWKCLFLAALGREIQFLPSLDGSTFVPYGGRSSQMTKADMGDLLSFMTEWGDKNGVVWSDPQAPKQGEVAA